MGEISSEEWRRLFETAVKVALPIVGSEAEAQDCASRALIQLFEYEHPIENVEAWLVTVARRRALDSLRRNERERAAITRAAATIADDDVIEIVDLRRKVAQLDRLVGSLPEPSRTIVRLVGEGLSLDEAATEIGLTRMSAKGHLQRARRAIRAGWLGGVAVLVRWLQRPRFVRVASLGMAAAAIILLAPWMSVPFTAAPRSPQKPGPGCIDCAGRETHLSAEATSTATLRVEETMSVTVRDAGNSGLVATQQKTEYSSRQVYFISESSETPYVVEIARLEHSAAPAAVVKAVVWCAGHPSVGLQDLGCKAPAPNSHKTVVRITLP